MRQSHRSQSPEPATRKNAKSPPARKRPNLSPQSATQKVQEALRPREREPQPIADAAPVLLTRISRDLRYLFVNRACAQMLGRPAEDIIGQPVVEIIGEEALEKIRPYFEDVLKGERVEYETEIPYQGIAPRLMHVTYEPEKDAQGGVVGWLAVLQDITERKRSDEALRQSEQRLALVASATGIGLFDSNSVTGDIAATEQWSGILRPGSRKRTACQSGFP